MMKKIHFLILLLSLCFAPKVFAASVTVVAPGHVARGDEFSVTIAAATDGEPINSADIVLDFDEHLLAFSGYQQEGTVMGLWVVPPHEEGGKILMSGIIPGGVSGLYDAKKPGLGAVPLARLSFTATSAGIATFSLGDTSLLRHDGRGTALAHEDAGASIVVDDGPPSGGAPAGSADTAPPDPFAITLVESSLFSKTPSMILFNAADSGSGVKGYAMRVGTSAWRDAANPQPVGKSIFSRTISVRAYDFAGNFQEESIHIPGFVPTRLLWAVLILISSGILGYKLLKYKA